MMLLVVLWFRLIHHNEAEELAKYPAAALVITRLTGVLNQLVLPLQYVVFNFDIDNNCRSNPPDPSIYLSNHEVRAATTA